MSAPIVCRDGKPFGVYLDDSTPNLPFWISKAQARYLWVLVSRPPGAWSCPWNVRCVHEYYPFDCHRAWRLRSAVRYVVQWRYAWPGCAPPSPQQAAHALLDVLKLNPELVMVY